MMTKFERIKQHLENQWGFVLYRADPQAHGRFYGDWKTGYIVRGNMHGPFLTRFRSLSEIERSWMMKEKGSNTLDISQFLCYTYSIVNKQLAITEVDMAYALRQEAQQQFGHALSTGDDIATGASSALRFLRQDSLFWPVRGLYEYNRLDQMLSHLTVTGKDQLWEGCDLDVWGAINDLFDKMYKPNGIIAIG